MAPNKKPVVEKPAKPEVEVVTEPEVEVVTEPEVEVVTEPEVEVVTEPEVKEVNQDICYRLLNCNRYKCRVGRLPDGSAVDINGVDGIIIVDASKPGYAMRKAYLEAHPGNRNNGGTKFVELTNADDKKLGNGNIIDELLSMSREALIAVITDKDPLDKVTSTGKLMMKILKQKGLVK